MSVPLSMGNLELVPVVTTQMKALVCAVSSVKYAQAQSKAAQSVNTLPKIHACHAQLDIDVPQLMDWLFYAVEALENSSLMKDKANAHHVLLAFNALLSLISLNFVHMELTRKPEMLFARYVQLDLHATPLSFYPKFVQQDFMQEKDQLSV